MQNARLSIYPLLLEVMMRFFSLSITICLLALQSSSFAASFDCTKATSQMEKFICQDHELSRLDEQLATLYKQQVSSSPDSSQLKASQRAWLKIAKECPSVDCLRKEYQERLAQIRLLPGNDSPATIADTGSSAAKTDAAGRSDDQPTQKQEEPQQAAQQPSASQTQPAPSTKEQLPTPDCKMFASFVSIQKGRDDIPGITKSIETILGKQIHQLTDDDIATVMETMRRCHADKAEDFQYDSAFFTSTLGNVKKTLQTLRQKERNYLASEIVAKEVQDLLNETQRLIGADGSISTAAYEKMTETREKYKSFQSLPEKSSASMDMTKKVDGQLNDLSMAYENQKRAQAELEKITALQLELQSLQPAAENIDRINNISASALRFEASRNKEVLAINKAIQNSSREKLQVAVSAQRAAACSRYNTSAKADEKLLKYEVFTDQIDRNITLNDLICVALASNTFVSFSDPSFLNGESFTLRIKGADLLFKHMVYDFASHKFLPENSPPGPQVVDCLLLTGTIIDGKKTPVANLIEAMNLITTVYAGLKQKAGL